MPFSAARPSQCADGRNRLRLIYNALYEEQVRTYEIFLQPDGVAGMNIGVLADQGNVASLSIGKASDALGPWSMKRGERILTANETRELVGLLEASAAFGPPRDGLRLPDNDFWWTIDCFTLSMLLPPVVAFLAYCRKLALGLVDEICPTSG